MARKASPRKTVPTMSHEAIVSAVVPSKMSSGYDYLRDVAAFSSTQSDNDTVEMCWKLYTNEGIVGSVIDKMIDFAITPGSVEGCNDQELLTLLEEWVNNVNGFVDEKSQAKIDSKPIPGAKTFSDIGLYGVCAAEMLHELVSGDAVLVENWSKDVFVPQLKKKFILPKSINIHDIRNIEIDDSASSLGLEVLKVKVDSKILDILRKADKENPLFDQLQLQLGKDTIKQIVDNNGEVILPPILTTHFKNKGFGRPRGIPFLRRSFSAIAAKRRLQALDEATIAGMIQRLTIIMVGHPDVNSPYHVPQKDRVTALRAELLKMKTQRMLVWNGPDLSVIDIGPDGKVLSFDNRFSEADDSISVSLGIPRILIDGSSAGTSSRDWVVIVSTMAMLERMREKLKARIDAWLRSIAVKNGYEDEFPTWRWSIMALRDERAAKTLVMKAYEDGLVGREDTLHFLGLPAKEIIDKMIEESNDSELQQLTAPQIAYTAPKEGEKVGKPKVGDGKPTGSKDKSVTPRQPAAAAAEENLEKNNMLSMYRGMYQAIDNNDGNIDTVVRASLEYFSSMARKFVLDYYTIYSQVDPDHDYEWGMRISSWAHMYVDNLRGSIIKTLRTHDYTMSNEERRASIKQYLSEQEYRVGMFVDAVHAKVNIINQLKTIQDSGFTHVRVRTDNKTCAACNKAQSINYKLSDAFNVVPVHIGCKCQLEGVSEGRLDGN